MRHGYVMQAMLSSSALMLTSCAALLIMARSLLQAFQLSNGLLSQVSVSQSSTPFGYPGSTPSISANGSDNGILWTLQVDAYNSSGPAVLHAYDAGNLANELYTSGTAPADQLDGAVKFTVPTVANGKVYVSTQSSLAVFGLLSGPTQTWTFCS